MSWTVSDLLGEIRERDPSLAGRVFLLEDCMSPVVIPGVADFSDAADAASRKLPRSPACTSCAPPSRSRAGAGLGEPVSKVAKER